MFSGSTIFNRKYENENWACKWTPNSLLTGKRNTYNDDFSTKTCFDTSQRFGADANCDVPGLGAKS